LLVDRPPGSSRVLMAYPPPPIAVKLTAVRLCLNHISRYFSFLPQHLLMRLLVNLAGSLRRRLPFIGLLCLWTSSWFHTIHVKKARMILSFAVLCRPAVETLPPFFCFFPPRCVFAATSRCKAPDIEGGVWKHWVVGYLDPQL